MDQKSDSCTCLPASHFRGSWCQKQAIQQDLVLTSDRSTCQEAIICIDSPPQSPIPRLLRRFGYISIIYMGI